VGWWSLDCIQWSPFGQVLDNEDRAPKHIHTYIHIYIHTRTYIHTHTHKWCNLSQQSMMMEVESLWKVGFLLCWQVSLPLRSVFYVCYTNICVIRDNSRIPVCVCVCIHTYIHTYIHTFVHTYTHPHIRGCIQKFPAWVDNEIYVYNNKH